MDSPLSDLPSSPEEGGLNNSMITPFEAYLSSQTDHVNETSTGNKRVYQIANDGKLKLKINLKGLGIGNGNGDSHKIDIMSNPKQGHSVPSQTTGPETHTKVVHSNTHPLQTAINPAVIVNQESLNLGNGYSSDVFSDDIDLDDLFKNEVVNRRLSDKVSTFMTHKTFNLTIKLKPGYLPTTPRGPANATFEPTSMIESPGTGRKLKTPTKPKVKKRSKVPHSRYIHKMPISVPEKPDENEDDEILEKSLRLSLKDPVSGSRLVTPLRSKYCSHLECFDYDSFLAMYNLKPFKVGLKRYSPPSPNVGDVDVMKLFEDTKRPVLKRVEHNVNTAKFQIKSKQKLLKEKGKQMNELEWFCCPICNLEFNIKHFGELYVVGEFVDLLLDLLHEPNQEDIDAIEIDMHSGTFKWLCTGKTEEKKKIDTTSEVVILSDEDEDEDDAGAYQAVKNASPVRQKEMKIEPLPMIPLLPHMQPLSSLPINLPSDSPSPFRALPLQMDAQTEKEMFKQIDALFEAEGIATNTFAPQMNRPNGGTHAGVVGFRPGAFVEPEAEPVFMTGDGGADDPIVLD